MDIQIVDSHEYYDPNFVVIRRTLDGMPFAQRQPKDVLFLRAAEYNLEPDDPRVLDMVLLECFTVWDPTMVVAPLYQQIDIEEALSIVEGKIEDVRVEHGAPEEPMMRQLFTAADLEESTEGLTLAKTILFKGDHRVMPWHKIMRDEGRKEMASVSTPMEQMLKGQALAILHEQAMDEHRMRFPVKPTR